MKNEDAILRSLERVAKHYTVHPAHSAGLQELFDFFKTAYAGEFNAAGYRDDKKINDKWEWANIKNPNIGGFRSRAWICRENNSNKIVGHMGIMPVSLKHKDRYYPSAWGRDLVVLPEYRQFGIGPFLVSRVLQETRDSLAIFLIAGVRDHVYPMYKKFGFADMGRIPLYVRINRPGPMIRSKIDIKFITPLLELFGNLAVKLLYMPQDIRRYAGRKDEGIRIAEISRFDDSFNKLWESASAPFGLIVRRDARYLNWRFIDQPYARYKIFKVCRNDSNDPAGYIVIRRGESRGLQTGVISDIFALSNKPDIVRALVDHAVAYFKGMDGVAFIRCDMLNRDVEKVLKGRGFIRIASNERFMFANIRGGLDATFFKDRDNWFLDYSDSDLDLSGQISA